MLKLAVIQVPVSLKWAYGALGVHQLCCEGGVLVLLICV